MFKILLHVLFNPNQYWHLFQEFEWAPILFLIKTPVLTTVQRFLAVMLAVLNS